MVFRLLQFGTCIIVCELNPDVPCVPPLAIEAMPEIICPSTRYHYLFESHPSLSDEFGLFVVVEHRDFQLVVVGGIVNGEAQLLIPKASQSGSSVRAFVSHHFGVCPPLLSVSVFFASFPSLAAQ